MSKKNNYLNEMIDFENTQYLPETYHIVDGKLPREIGEYNRKPLLTAIVKFVLNVPIGILAIIYSLKEYAKSGYKENSLIVPIIIFTFFIVLYVMASVNYLIKYKKQKESSKLYRMNHKHHKRKNK